jgi:hypothetical protein
LYLDEILEVERGIHLKPGPESMLDPQAMLALIREDKRLSIDPVDKAIIISGRRKTAEKKLDELKKLLQQLPVGS